MLCAAITVPALCSESTSTRNQPLTRTALRYDTDYPVVGYADLPANNAVAKLQARLDRGEVKLEFDAVRGYLDSLLKALDIDVSSQTLVYSKTSLQIEAIRAATPRAIYFNDDTYVAWVQGTNMLEFAAMDSRVGQVFYTLHNSPASGAEFNRETTRCLTCHDTFSLMGGGVPRFLFMSAFVNTNGESLTAETSNETTDATPIEERWGGWYVTGYHGTQTHLGNIQVRSAAEITDLDKARRGNLDNLKGLLDTRPYLTDKSDIVALLVFEHQAYVENFITRANFKARTVVARETPEGAAPPHSLDELSPKTQFALKAMLEPVVKSLLFVDAAGLTSPITGTSGFDKWFQARGLRDPQGRSLRDLDLTTRVFKYPLSYLIYSRGFEGLPDYAKAYVYARLAAILEGRDTSDTYAHIAAADRKAALEILIGTKPAFARALRT